MQKHKQKSGMTMITNHDNNNSNNANVNPTTATTAPSSLSQSLTIDEMRSFHANALSEAKRKQTELKLVLASRYRELVGSSDEVLNMANDAKELHDFVCGLPELVKQLHLIQVQASIKEREETSASGSDTQSGTCSNVQEQDRIQLSIAPRKIHAQLDLFNVHEATTTLLQTFHIIYKYTRQYPLINTLLQQKENMDFHDSNNNNKIIQIPNEKKLLLMTQIKMIYLHLQSIPLYTVQLSKQILIQQQQQQQDHIHHHAHNTVMALSALHRLNVAFFQYDTKIRANKLLDLYFTSKATLIQSLLDQLTFTNYNNNDDDDDDDNDNNSSSGGGDDTEQIVSKIILVLQYDIILHPFQIFVLRNYKVKSLEQQQQQQHQQVIVDNIMPTIPKFDTEQVKTKTSNFLAAHLPLIRSKVKAVLVGIAGTTANRLGSIRQSLYDKTDGDACIKALSCDGICTWDDAVQHIVDVRVITRALDGLSSSSNATNNVNNVDNTNTTTTGTATSSYIPSTSQRKFSLWSTLFSNTFSSLVHSILTTSFHSVHRQVVATLRSSLANAPSFTSILPHEAYRNTLHIASELDIALKKVSDDAHELLVHAEEREKSERRLRQSLYVQTCEIMGRLLNELRRMLSSKTNIQNQKEEEDATKELIIGRLCHLLKFRLTSLPKLLHPESSPAVLSSSSLRSGVKSGMITVDELQSAFEISNINDDGLINFEEAMEAMDGAFSGTQFHGAEMVRETMLLSASKSDDKTTTNAATSTITLTLSELTLLSARGLRHDSKGPGSSLGIIQNILDSIIESCICRWSEVALAPYTNACMNSMQKFMIVSSSTNEEEWKRLNKYYRSTGGESLQSEITNALEEKNDCQSIASSVQVGNVSSFIISYLLSVTSLLNKNICPSDSLPPYPSNEYAIAMGFDTKGKDITMVDTLRAGLLKKSLSYMTGIISAYVLEQEDFVSEDVNGDKMVTKFGPSALVQLLLDLKFITDCFFQRNKYEFMNVKDELSLESHRKLFEKSKKVLSEAEASVSTMISEHELEFGTHFQDFDSKFEAVYSSCGMFLTSLFGENKPMLAMADDNTVFNGFGEGDEFSLILNPLPSSRRFMLLPIQVEQSMKELQLVRNLEKERGEKVEIEKLSGASAAANAVSSSIGYFSSLLKKK